MKKILTILTILTLAGSAYAEGFSVKANGNLGYGKTTEDKEYYLSATAGVTAFKDFNISNFKLRVGAGADLQNITFSNTRTFTTDEVKQLVPEDSRSVVTDATTKTFNTNYSLINSAFSHIAVIPHIDLEIGANVNEELELYVGSSLGKPISFEVQETAKKYNETLDAAIAKSNASTTTSETASTEETSTETTDSSTTEATSTETEQNKKADIAINTELKKIVENKLNTTNPNFSYKVYAGLNYNKFAFELGYGSKHGFSVSTGYRFSF